MLRLDQGPLYAAPSDVQAIRVVNAGGEVSMPIEQLFSLDAIVAAVRAQIEARIGPLPTTEQVTAAIADGVGAQVAAALAAQGIGDIGTFALASLPDPALSARRTLWCSDLFGTGGRMVSEGGFWKAIRPLATATMATPSADLTLQPFVNATTLIVTGALSATRNLTLGAGSGNARAHPGYRVRLTRKATGLMSLVVNGVGIGLNGWADFEYDGSVWQQTGSGGLI